MRTRWEEGENSGKESKMKRDRIVSYFICFCLFVFFAHTAPRDLQDLSSLSRDRTPQRKCQVLITGLPGNSQYFLFSTKGEF